MSYGKRFAIMAATFCYATAFLCVAGGAPSSMPWFLVAGVIVTLFILTKDVDQRP